MGFGRLIITFSIIAKIIANRLKGAMPSLVAQNQCSFIQGRQGADNIIIVQEVFHSMLSMKDSKGVMAIKVDFEKAYDRLEWDFCGGYLAGYWFLGRVHYIIEWLGLRCKSFSWGKNRSFSPDTGHTTRRSSLTISFCASYGETETSYSARS